MLCGYTQTSLYTLLCCLCRPADAGVRPLQWPCQPCGIRYKPPLLIAADIDSAIFFFFMPSLGWTWSQIWWVREPSGAAGVLLLLNWESMTGEEGCNILYRPRVRGLECDGVRVGFAWRRKLLPQEPQTNKLVSGQLGKIRTSFWEIYYVVFFPRFRSDDRYHLCDCEGVKKSKWDAGRGFSKTSGQSQTECSSLPSCYKLRWPAAGCICTVRKQEWSLSSHLTLIKTASISQTVDLWF